MLELLRLRTWSSFPCVLFGALSIGIASSIFLLACLSKFSFYYQHLSILYTSEVALDWICLQGIFLFLKAMCHMFDSVIPWFHIEQSSFTNSLLLNAELDQMLSFFLLILFLISVLMDQITSCPTVGGVLYIKEGISEWLCFLQVLV